MLPHIRDAQSQPAKPGEPITHVSRVSAALASPLSVLFVVPALVVVVGVALTWLADRALRASNLSVARERLRDQAETVADLVRVALVQADPMLERLDGLTAHHQPASRFEPLAHALVDLMQGRPGVAFVSVSFPDGTFQGAYADENGELRFQDSRVSAQGTRVRRYALGARDQLTLLREDITQYDPRLRDFYRLAVRERQPVWSEPYPFFDSHQTGVTRTKAQLEGEGAARKVRAVLTVDYDVHAMSSFLAAQRFPGMRAVLYASDGTVLAYAGDSAAPLPKLQEARTLRFSDLSDPVMRAFFAQAQRVGHAAQQLSRIELDGEPYLAVVARASEDPKLDWSVAYLAPESHFLKALYLHQRRSLWVSSALLLLAVLVSISYARHITRARREVLAAKQEAARARAQARELGSYRLKECLGRGGMGEVWRAEHRLLAREAAVKLINAQARGDVSELKQRFRREAEALAKLRSRHTIELYDYGVADDGTFFLVMELLDGMDLETLVRSAGPQPWERVVNLLIQVCSSLAEAHDAGLVHRDIKPANIFVCRAADELDIVKVLDFGLVRSALSSEREPVDTSTAAQAPADEGLAGLTLRGGVMGTPGFMPPEQVFGRELSGRSDLYALGAVAYFLLSGQLVFDHGDAQARITAAVSEELPDLRTRVPEDVPEALLALIASCLSRAPAGRPESAAVLARSLRALLPAQPQVWTEARMQAFWAQPPRVAPRLPASDPRDVPTRTVVARADSVPA